MTRWPWKAEARSQHRSMPLVNQGLLGAYYGATYWYRRRWMARAMAAERAPVMVLFYHRVADDMATPWTITPRAFARQMEWLSRHFELVSLSEAQERVRCGRNAAPAVCITFDDGYAENCQAALPLLIRRRIPCTYFVCTHHVLHGEAFPHDIDRGLRFAPNTVEELQQLAAAGIEIGAHTRSHADLGRVTDPEMLYDELVTAGAELQSAVGRPVRYFAFPFGKHINLNAAAFHLAYEHGYEAVCSAYGGYNFPGDDAFHLQRIPADEVFLRLKNWTTVDPRKLRVRRFFYGPGMMRATVPRAVRG